MTLTPAGRFVVFCLILTILLLVVGVAARVASGQWGAEIVTVVAITAPLVTLIALMAWRWDA